MLEVTLDSFNLWQNGTKRAYLELGKIVEFTSISITLTIYEIVLSKIFMFESLLDIYIYFFFQVYFDIILITKI